MPHNNILGAEIPYFGMMKKTMPKDSKPKKKKFKSHRLTEIDQKTKKPRLKENVSIDRAVEVLFMFENADVTPQQIYDMKTTITNLQTRIKKLEDW